MSTYDASLMEIAGYPISWLKEDLPVGVFFDPDLESDIIAAHRIVAVELNHLIDHELIGLGSRWMIGSLPQITPRGYITLSSFDPLPNTIGDSLYGHVGHTVSEGRILSANVKIRRGMDTDFLLTIMRHEMGHVLGLAHDEKRVSIMSRTIGIMPPKDVHFTNHDIALLLKIYG